MYSDSKRMMVVVGIWLLIMSFFDFISPAEGVGRWAWLDNLLFKFGPYTVVICEAIVGVLFVSFGLSKDKD